MKIDMYNVMTSPKIKYDALLAWQVHSFALTIYSLHPQSYQVVGPDKNDTRGGHF